MLKNIRHFKNRFSRKKLQPPTVGNKSKKIHEILSKSEGNIGFPVQYYQNFVFLCDLLSTLRDRNFISTELFWKFSDIFSRRESNSFIFAVLVARSKTRVPSHNYLWDWISGNSKIHMCNLTLSSTSGVIPKRRLLSRYRTPKVQNYKNQYQSYPELKKLPKTSK